MTPDEHMGHGDQQPPPEPQPASNMNAHDPRPLLENPTVTIYFDGLIFMAYNASKQISQAAILTEAQGHHLVIEVREKGTPALLWPAQPSDWDPDHGAIKARAPFWLYVDSGKKLWPGDFSAALHLPADKDEQAYQRVFNFEKIYNRPLPLKQDTFAVFNFPHGASYSATNMDAKLSMLRTAQMPSSAIPEGEIHISSLAAIDIDAVSNGSDTRSIVLANKDGENEFFRFKLEPGIHYDIRILNQPIDDQMAMEHEHEHEHDHDPNPNPDHDSNHDARKHFLMFYGLFDLKPGEKEFLVDKPPPPPSSGENLPNSPPCVSTSGSPTSGLG